ASIAIAGIGTIKTRNANGNIAARAAATPKHPTNPPIHDNAIPAVAMLKARAALAVSRCAVIASASPATAITPPTQGDGRTREKNVGLGRLRGVQGNKRRPGARGGGGARRPKARG